MEIYQSIRFPAFPEVYWKSTGSLLDVNVIQHSFPSIPRSFLKYTGSLLDIYQMLLLGSIRFPALPEATGSILEVQRKSSRHIICIAIICHMHYIICYICYSLCHFVTLYLEFVILYVMFVILYVMFVILNAISVILYVISVIA